MPETLAHKSLCNKPWFKLPSWKQHSLNQRLEVCSLAEAVSDLGEKGRTAGSTTSLERLPIPFASESLHLYLALSNAKPAAGKDEQEPH